jgi:hypothetical protein
LQPLGCDRPKLLRELRAIAWTSAKSAQFTT